MNEFGFGGYYPILIKFNEEEILSEVIIEHYSLQNLETHLSIIETESGDLLIAGSSNSQHAIMFITDSNGNFISKAQDHIDFELGGANSYFRGISKNLGQ